jgi:NRPS condensation-like uncharacterized protein
MDISNNLKPMKTEFIPNTFPTVQIDDMLSTIGMACDLQIHATIHFEDHINRDILKKAIRLSVDAEPVLGCHLEKISWKQQWKRCSDEKLNSIFDYKETSESEVEQLEYMRSAYSPYEDPALKALLIRSKSSDTLCIKLSHIALDGGGTKEYLKLLVNIYNQLLKDINFQPSSNYNGCRDFHQVTKSFSVKDRIKNIRLNVRDYITNIYPPKSWQYPKLGQSKKSESTYVFHELNTELVKSIKSFAMKNEVSLTDILMAAFYRALYQQISPKPKTPLRLGTTVDLRRYLKKKKGDALCNLAAMFYLNIGNGIGNNLLETAQKVAGRMEHHKKENIGMGDNRYALFDQKFIPFPVAKHLNLIHQVIKFIIGPKQVPPLLTYVGKLDHTLRMFKDSKICQAYISAPIAYSPVFFICLTGYGGQFTMCSGIRGSEEDQKLVKDLFKSVEEILSNAEKP